MNPKTARRAAVLSCFCTPLWKGYSPGPPRPCTFLSLTGVPDNKLASRILGYPALLHLSEALLQRKRNAVVATMGDQAAQTILCMQPEVLAMDEKRAVLNIAALQQLFGVSRESAAGILCSNTRLFKLGMENDITAAKLSARVAFWQQAYGLSAGEQVSNHDCF